MVRAVRTKQVKKTLANLGESDGVEKNSPEESKGCGLSFGNCLSCGKKISEGYYGRFEDGGVCSKKCNAEYKRKREQSQQAAASKMMGTQEQRM